MGAGDLLIELLEHNKLAIYPGNGKKNAQLIRKICNLMQWDEDNYLPSFVVREKDKWGLS